ncbi:AAA family ATPase, partial [Streptomyces sp. NPDC039028]|uniref:AAA family ATPase n=1 Tax=Streptomyces sp. NPDC039028 TaxID=3155370 RepID=UPI0033F2B7E2
MTTAPYLALRPTGPGGPPAPVGREELLARLERALHTRGRALLTGPAGVGKTELALAAATRAEARGETVLWLATLPSDREIPGASAAALVASVAATVSLARPGGRRRETRPSDKASGGRSSTAPEASAVFDELPGPQRTAVAMLCREAPLDAGGWDPIALRLGIAQILRTLTRRGPVLLVVDGVQHVDADSADLLRFALHLAPPALRVVAVETPEPYGEADEPYRAPHRPDDPHAAHLWVPSEADVLLVPPLHADEIAELLIHHRLPSRMAGRIHRASGGNPRLALAVGRSLADARTPVHHAEALTLSGRARDLARQLLGAAPLAVRVSRVLAA